jgi:multidrug efflux pump
LVLSTGAGSASQNAIGTGVAGGMLSATVLAVFLVPVFYIVVSKIARRKVSAEATAVETPVKGEPSHV